MIQFAVTCSLLILLSTTVPTTVSITTAPPSNSAKVIVCYFTNWAQYRDGIGKQLPEDLPPHLCTHYVYAFAKIPMGQNKLEAVEWNDISQLYPSIMSLKNQNPNLKITLAVGGWTHGVESFSMMAQSKGRNIF